MTQPRVVAIMPVRNEARHLESVLQSITAQDFDHSRLYFIAVDGASEDGSVEILEKWLRTGDIPGVVLHNPRRKIPIALNMGLRMAADADVVVRLDAHTIYGERYLSDAVGGLEKSPQDVACVGGAHLPLPPARFSERIVAALYTNPMGLGGADYRFGNGAREVDHVYLGVWRPGVLQAAGGFNEDLDANEDAEMSARIRLSGYRILRLPLPCRFIVNRGLAATMRQWHRYGFWRCKMLQNNPKSIRRRHVLNPLAALVVVGLACSPARLLLLPIFAAYWAAIYLRRPAGQANAVTIASMAYFPAVQFAYAAGMFAALVAGAGRGRRGVGRRPVAAD